MVHRSWRRLQRGYMLEIPILLMVVVLVVALVLPHLPPLGRKIFLGVAAVPVLFFLFYMIVIPGWTPGSAGRLRAPWNWLVFLLLAGAIVFVVVAFALGR
ncbi:MAG TPA: hypothetical protein VH105_03325 [Burkholderiales bacterium]|nr:hypothetical protein [Burkholderiales bacterium]